MFRPDIWLPPWLVSGDCPAFAWTLLALWPVTWCALSPPFSPNQSASLLPSPCFPPKPGTGDYHLNQVFNITFNSVSLTLEVNSGYFLEKTHRARTMDAIRHCCFLANIDSYCDLSVHSSTNSDYFKAYLSFHICLPSTVLLSDRWCLTVFSRRSQEHKITSLYHHLLLTSLLAPAVPFFLIAELYKCRLIYEPEFHLFSTLSEFNMTITSPSFYLWKQKDCLSH